MNKLRSANIKSVLVICFFISFLFSCAPSTRYGMVKDPISGIQYGSVIEKSFFIDASQFENSVVKLSTRNASGDSSYNIKDLRTRLKESLIEKGFLVNDRKNFGIKSDVIVEYSGHVQENLALKYGFLGGLAGGIAGYRSSAKASEAIGILSGATLGSIIGSYTTNDTYIIITKVTIGIIDRMKDSQKSVVFSSSPDLQDEDKVLGVNYFNEVKTTKVAVFAGGRNIKHSDVIEGVKSRLYGIITDII